MIIPTAPSSSNVELSSRLKKLMSAMQNPPNITPKSNESIDIALSTCANDAGHTTPN
jgi:hypothetical protein